MHVMKTAAASPSTGLTYSVQLSDESQKTTVIVTCSTARHVRQGTAEHGTQLGKLLSKSQLQNAALLVDTHNSCS